jgi:hypothetical protein
LSRFIGQARIQEHHAVQELQNLEIANVVRAVTGAQCAATTTSSSSTAAATASSSRRNVRYGNKAIAIDIGGSDATRWISTLDLVVGN